MINREILEKWTQKYKKSIDCSNPKGFSQRAHCQGRKKKLHEDLRRWFKEKWTAQDGSECGDYKGRGRVKCRPSRRVSDKSPQTWGEMSKEEKKKAVRKKQEAHRKGKQWSSHKSGKTWDGPKNKYKPKKKKMDESYLIEDDVIRTGENPAEYKKRLLQTIESGDISSMDNHDRVHGALAYVEKLQPEYRGNALNIVVRHFRKGGAEHASGLIVTGIDPRGKSLLGYPTGAGGTSTRHRALADAEIKNVSGLHLSRYSFMKPEHRNVLRRLMDFRGIQEMTENFKQLIIEKRKAEGKPYKGFKKGKNHPEGGLSRAEAKRQGIHAGIETKDEAKRKGGFGKLSGKTQKRRKSFCARMCGMKKRRTSSKTARDPKSKINAALRVWGCRCGTNESFNLTGSYLTEALLLEKNNPTDKKLWSRAKALARKKFDVYPSAYANAWAAKWYKKHGGGWSKGKVNEQFSSITEICKNVVMNKLVSEEIVNSNNAGSMTKAELSLRDKIEKKVKGIKPIKKGDSEKNARYRFATYLVLKKREKEKGKKETKGKKKKK